jgi:hypothetical protein
MLPVPMRTLTVLVIALAVVAAPSPVLARGGDDEIRTRGSCARGISSELRAKADHGTIELRFELLGARRASTWRVTIVQERHIVWRRTVRLRGSSRSLRVERTLGDLPGADAIGVRALGPQGASCWAGGTLTGD